MFYQNRYLKVFFILRTSYICCLGCISLRFQKLRFIQVLGFVLLKLFHLYLAKGSFLPKYQMMQYGFLISATAKVVVTFPQSPKHSSGAKGQIISEQNFGVFVFRKCDKIIARISALATIMDQIRKTMAQTSDK